MSLTVQQHRLLTFLVERITATGVCPSVKEMMHALDSKGRGVVSDTIDILEQRGYLRRLFQRRARCIEILRLPDDLSRRWLEGVSNAAMVHELRRRGIGAETRAGHVLCGDCGAERCLLPGADLALAAPPPPAGEAGIGAACIGEAGVGEAGMGEAGMGEMGIAAAGLAPEGHRFAVRLDTPASVAGVER